MKLKHVLWVYVTAASVYAFSYGAELFSSKSNTGVIVGFTVFVALFFLASNVIWKQRSPH